MLDINDPHSIHKKLSTIDASITPEQASEFVNDDCIVHEAISLPYGGDYYGPAGFAEAVQTVFGTWKDFGLDILNVWTDNVDTMIQISEIRGSTSKGSFKMPMVEYYKIKNGKMSEITVIYYDTKLLADLAD